MRKKLLPVLLTLVLAVALLTVGALAAAEEPGPGEGVTVEDPNINYIYVQQDGVPVESGSGTKNDPYKSLDYAVAEADEGSVIWLLSDCDMDTGFNKTLTFTGNGKITIDSQLMSDGEGWMCFGLYDPSRVLTFTGAGLSVDWSANGDTKWLMLSLSGKLEVNDSAKFEMHVDSLGASNRNAIYLNAGAEINVSDNAFFAIYGVGTEGKPGQGLQLDQAGRSEVNVTGQSTFLIDGTNRGYVSSPTIYVEDSTFTVQNCTSNASNGGEFTAIRSTINYLNNNGHGLSAGNVTIEASTLNCNNNAYYGLTYSGNMTMDSTSVINANDNGRGYTGGGLRAYGTSTVESGARINIISNDRNGMENYGTFNIAEGAVITVVDNEEPSTNGGGIYNGGMLNLPSNTTIERNHAYQTGGGICNAGTVNMSAGVQIYNNHAGNAGDDIYNRDGASITFPETGTDWRLDGEPDCTDAIDGWYDDSEGARWEAHAKTTAGNHTELISSANFDEETGLYTVTGLHAYKAAHGIIPITITPADIIIYMGGNDGYDGVANGSGTITASNTLPTPGFTFSGLPEGTDPTDIIFSGAGERAWHVELYPGLSEDAVHKLYTIVPSGTENQDPVRVQFKVGENDYVVSDEFIVGLEVNTSFEMSIYPGNAGEVSATIDGQAYTVELGSGILTVRGVTENSAYAEVEVTGTAQTAGEPGLTAPENTVFYVNGSEVQVTDEGSVALLFDDIIDTGSENRTEQLVDRAEQEIGAFDSYEAKYLDLVDRNNGDAWVTASNAVTVYWPLPEGTNRFTDFTLLHFEDLDRDMASDEIENDIANCVVDEIEITEVTGTHVVFNVTSGNFSPFMLVWDTDGGDEPVIPPVRPTDPVRPQEPDGLNTEDHVAYIIGYPDGEVKPEGNITRAEVATIFFRLLTDETREEYWSQTNGYTDVARDAWYNNAISTLSNLGIIDGYEDGSFRPNSPITRAEFTKIAVSFFEYADIEYEGTFSDVAEGRWYTQFVAAAVEMGLIEGYPDGTFRPDASITRAEACTIVNRTLGRAPHEDHLLPEEEMITWPDNLYGAWYYADMQEATNSHDYEWTTEDSERVEDWTEKLPERDWDALEEIWSEANDAPGGEVIG